MNALISRSKTAYGETPCVLVLSLCTNVDLTYFEFDASLTPVPSIDGTFIMKVGPQFKHG